jgi:hypothetical protein
MNRRDDDDDDTSTRRAAPTDAAPGVTVSVGSATPIHWLRWRAVGLDAAAPDLRAFRISVPVHIADDDAAAPRTK